MASVLFAERLMKDRHKLPEDFHFYKWECLGGPDNYHSIQLWGGRCGPITKGKRAGEPDFKSRDKNNDRSFIVTNEETDEFTRQWEQSTGNCANCDGDGKTVKSIDFVKGVTTYRTCFKCKGTGKCEALSLLKGAGA